MRSLALVLTAVATLQACVAHVPLPPAPPPSAPIEQRVTFYRNYRPVQTGGMARVSLNTWGGVAAVQTSTDHVVLANGTTVYAPTDLTQMVGEDSPTAEVARRAESQQNLADGFVWGGLAGSTVGIVLMLVSLFQPVDYSSSDTGLNATFWAGVGMGLAGSIASGIGRWAFAPQASSSRLATFQGLDGVLRARMGLCGEGEALRDCNAPAPQYVPAPAAPTAPVPWQQPPGPALPPPPPASPTATTL